MATLALIDPRQEEFTRLAETYRRRLAGIARQFFRHEEDVEDAVQGGLLRAWRGLGTFDGRAGMAPWLSKIVRNYCLEVLRRRRHLEGLEATSRLSDGRNLENQIVARVTLGEIERRLPAQAMRVLIRSAEGSDIPMTSTEKVRAFRARRELRQEYGVRKAAA